MSIEQITFQEKFITDRNGRRTAVVISMNRYLKMLQFLEEAKILKMIEKGENEYLKKKIKPIKSLSELDKQ